MEPPVKVKLEESDVRECLLQLSNESRDFYNNERHRAGRIEWFFNPHLKEQFVSAEAAHIYHIKEKYHEINLLRFPIPLDDARLVAHEIVHAILTEENHSLLVVPCDERYTSLSTNLGTLLEDPVVDSFLQERYHFDLTSDCVRRLSIIKQAWKNQSEPRGVPLLEVALLLANQMMKWRLIKNVDALSMWSDFLFWFGDEYPNILLIAVGFIASMQKVGLETLDKRKATYEEIVKNYQLEEY